MSTGSVLSPKFKARKKIFESANERLEQELSKDVCCIQKINVVPPIRCVQDT